EDDDDENSKLVSIKIEHNQEERQQQTSPTKLRSHRLCNHLSRHHHWRSHLL
ncbi:unnamed protein product, partial [Rotaria sordida]